MKRVYSSKDFTKFWKKKTEADERRRLKDIRLPFSRKLEILDELMEEAIFLSELRRAEKSSMSREGV